MTREAQVYYSTIKKNTHTNQQQHHISTFFFFFLHILYIFAGFLPEIKYVFVTLLNN